MDDSELANRELGKEFLSAVDVLRHAKNPCLWQTFVAVLFHLIALVLFRQSQAGGAGGRWEPGIEWMLAVSGFIGRASALIVAGVLIVSLLASLTARLGGAAALAKSCVWAMAALAMLVPWVRVAPEDILSVPSAFYGIDELSRQADLGPSTGDVLFGYLRFVLCPLLVAALLGVAQYWYRSAYVRRTALPSAKLPIREV